MFSGEQLRGRLGNRASSLGELLKISNQLPLSPQSIRFIGFAHDALSSSVAVSDLRPTHIRDGQVSTDALKTPRRCCFGEVLLANPPSQCFRCVGFGHFEYVPCINRKVDCIGHGKARDLLRRRGRRTHMPIPSSDVTTSGLLNARTRHVIANKFGETWSKAKGSISPSLLNLCKL